MSRASPRAKILALILAASPLAAQGAFVSPAGLATLEGNAYHWALFSQPKARFQQVDRSTRAATPRALKAIGFRRDGDQPGGAARMLTLGMRIGAGDWRAFTNTFAQNWKQPASVAIATKAFNLPDWSQKPPAPPAAFDLLLGFDQPCTHTGADDLLWELAVTQSSLPAYALYPVDRAYTQWTYGQSLSVGDGCTTPNGRFRLTGDPRATLDTLELGFAATGAPAAAAPTLILGSTPLGLPVPGLCGPLQTIALGLVPLPASDANGRVAPVFLRVRLDPALLGVYFVTQAVAPDPTQSVYPFALSNGLILRTPLQPGGPLVEASYTYDTTSPTAPVGSGPHAGAVVVRFEY